MSISGPFVIDENLQDKVREAFVQPETAGMMINMEKMKKQWKNALMMIQRFFILYPEAPESKKEIDNSIFNVL